MIKINIEKLLKKYLSKFLKAINIDTGVASAFTIITAKEQGSKTTMNPLNLTKKQQKLNIEIIETLVKGVNEDIAKKINYAVNKSIMENWDNKMLSEELKKLNIPEIYKNRFKAIAVTESNRIMNNSSYNTANKLGYKYKYIDIVRDNRTAGDSYMMYDKYGSPEKAIPIDEEFNIIYNGKEQRGLFPPLRPRDREFCRYLFEKPKE